MGDVESQPTSARGDGSPLSPLTSPPKRAFPKLVEGSCVKLSPEPWFCCMRVSRSPPTAPNYKLLKTIPIPGDGSWDYVTVDPVGRRVYLSHATKVDVIDADTGEIKGTIPDTAGVHGIAVVPELNRGFTSNGRANALTMFDLQTLKTVGSVPTARGPDSIPMTPP